MVGGLDPACFQVWHTELAEALERQSLVSDMAGPWYEGVDRPSISMAKAVKAQVRAGNPRALLAKELEPVMENFGCSRME
jgi:hypothetical protein